jgi:hypothetical protein
LHVEWNTEETWVDKGPTKVFHLLGSHMHAASRKGEQRPNTSDNRIARPNRDYLSCGEMFVEDKVMLNFQYLLEGIGADSWRGGRHLLCPSGQICLG